MSAANGKPAYSTFCEEFGETLAQILDLKSWTQGRDPASEHERIDREVREAIKAETSALKALRRRLEPQLRRPDVPGSGLHEVKVAEVLAAQQEFLFNGDVEAVDGTSESHAALPMVIHHSGVALVSYAGREGKWNQQLFRRETRLAGDDPYEAVLGLVERRRRRGMHSGAIDPLSELARRGFTSHMERLILAREAKSPWRMGHGSPAPLEMVAMGPSDFIIRSIRVIRELIEHGRFLFVASERSDWGEHMLGNMLRPLEYVVFDTLAEYMRESLEDWHPSDEPTEDTRWDAKEGPLDVRRWVQRFRDELATQVVYGFYRASPIAGPQMFFAHRDHVHTAARIAIADSISDEVRGFPMLIDMADSVCRTVYGGGSLRRMAEAAYASAGEPYRFQSERATRYFNFQRTDK